MVYRKLGNTDLYLSSIGLGTWAMGNDFFGHVDDQQSIKAIQVAIEEGINFIDTAPSYGNGHAEEIIGKAIKGKRDQVNIATKCGITLKGGEYIRNLKPERIEQEIDESLERLGIETIDLYQLHWPDPGTPIEDTINTLIKLKEKGKFRHLGVSNFDVELIDQMLTKTEVISLQPEYSLLNREIENGTIQYCLKHNIGIISYGTLAGGILTGKYREIPEFNEEDKRSDFYDYFKEPLWSNIQGLLSILNDIAIDHNRPVTQVALNWTTQQEGINTALVGAKNEEQVIINARASEWELNPEELSRIDTAFEKYMVVDLKAES